MNVSIRSQEGIKVQIEPDRFGGEGAEGRILSSLSIVAKLGSMKEDEETGFVEDQEDDVLIDKECARRLVLKELRAVLAKTLVKGIVIPMKK